HTLATGHAGAVRARHPLRRGGARGKIPRSQIRRLLPKLPVARTALVLAVVITVTAPLWLWSGGSWHFITVPEEGAVEIRAHSLLNRGGFGSVKGEATTNHVTWRASGFPQKC